MTNVNVTLRRDPSTERPGEVWSADSPHLPGFTAVGDTRTEVVESVLAAVGEILGDVGVVFTEETSPEDPGAGFLVKTSSATAGTVEERRLHLRVADNDAVPA